MHRLLGNSKAFVRRGLILPVILVVLLLLALLSASYAFQVQADHSAGAGMAQRLQTRMSAEAGIHAAMHVLRTQVDDPAAWYDNPEAFDQALVWSAEATPEELGKGTLIKEDSQKIDLIDSRADRFTLVADDPTDVEDKLEEGKIRFGITDEASKLNINVATPEQLLRLFQPVVVALGYEDTMAQQLVDALIDWRDADDEALNEEKPAESAYYATLDPPYRARNAPFETVEELLMVRGFSGRILYGEDYDRNGLLSELSEDDGNDVFPPDNADGLLERGIYPYITVYSREFNVSSENRQRLNLFGGKEQVRKKLGEIFERQEVIDFIASSTKKTGTHATRSLADYMEAQMISDKLIKSPLNASELDILFDKCTLSSQPEQIGLVNVNTAPPQVLRAVGIPPDAINNIVTTRQTLPAAQRTTLSWVVTKGGLTNQQFRLVDNYLTARARQFTIESIGYSDNRGIFTRLQAVVAMRGPVPQTIYYRDITRLGMGFPVRGKDGERRFALHADE